MTEPRRIRIRDRLAAYRALPSGVRRSQRRTHDIELEYADAMSGWAFVRTRRFSIARIVAALVGFLATSVSTAFAFRLDEPRIDRAIASLVALLGLGASIAASHAARRARTTLVAALERVGVGNRADTARPLSVHWRRAPATVIGLAATEVGVIAGAAVAWRLALGAHHPGMTAAAVVLGVLAAGSTLAGRLKETTLRRRTHGIAVDLDANGVTFPLAAETIAWTQVTNVYPTRGRTTTDITFEWRPVGGGDIVARSITLDDIRERPEDVIRTARSFMARSDSSLIAPTPR